MGHAWSPRRNRGLQRIGIHSKEQIEEYGIEPFNRLCIESVFRYTRQWEEMTRRIGFWVNLNDAYVTYHQSYVESVWWALKSLFSQGLLYQGHKVVWWWAQGGTALSAGEVGEGYRDTDDPSVFIRFAVKDPTLTRWECRRSDKFPCMDDNSLDLVEQCSPGGQRRYRLRPRRA